MSEECQVDFIPEQKNLNLASDKLGMTDAPGKKIKTE